MNQRRRLPPGQVGLTLSTASRSTRDQEKPVRALVKLERFRALCAADAVYLDTLKARYAAMRLYGVMSHADVESDTILVRHRNRDEQARLSPNDTQPFVCRVQGDRLDLDDFNRWHPMPDGQLRLAILWPVLVMKGPAHLMDDLATATVWLPSPQYVAEGLWVRPGSRPPTHVGV